MTSKVSSWLVRARQVADVHVPRSLAVQKSDSKFEGNIMEAHHESLLLRDLDWNDDGAGMLTK